MDLQKLHMTYQHHILHLFIIVLVILQPVIPTKAELLIAMGVKYVYLTSLKAQNMSVNFNPHTSLTRKRDGDQNTIKNCLS